MKSSGVKDFPKRGALPLHANHNKLIRSSSSSSKSYNQLNPGIAKSSTTRDDHHDVVVTPLTNNKNSRNDHTAPAAAATTTNTPPVEASVSPEFHTALTTPAPATGHHHVHTAISGITDNRKCRPRGLLLAPATIDTLSDEASVHFPSQASMHWLRNLSPDTCGRSDSSNSSANVMRTPTSADSETLLEKPSQFGSRLDSIDFSFEFDTNTNASSSVDLTRFRAPQLIRDSLCSDEGDGGDRFDECCRCLSEDEDPGFVFEDIVAEKKEFGSGCCAESMSIDGSGPPLASSKDSDWDFDERL